MTDPERISQRSSGLAAELLRAGATEQPRGPGMQRTLAALGVSGALLTTASTASAVGGATGTAAAALTGSKAVKTVSGLLLAKWIGVGMVGGVGLAGAAATVSAPAAPAASMQAAPLVQRPGSPRVVAPVTPAASELAEPPVSEVVPPPAPSVPAPGLAADRAEPELDLGAPLAAEVAFVDRARSALAAGRAEQGLAQLASYEREFPEARLLPEVLFLRLETCERLGRGAEARAAAQRLVGGFPKSPHAARARQLLDR
jgi:hypothetical protein